MAAPDRVKVFKMLQLLYLQKQNNISFDSLTGLTLAGKSWSQMKLTLTKVLAKKLYQLVDLF